MEAGIAIPLGIVSILAFFAVVAGLGAVLWFLMKDDTRGDRD